MLPLKVVPVAEKLGAPVPAAPTDTPTAFRSTVPPVKEIFPSTTDTPIDVEFVTWEADALLSTSGPADSTRIPVTAPSTVRPASVAGQCPATCTPLEKRTAGVPPEAAATRTVDSETGATSATPGQVVCTPGPVDVPLRTSYPESAPPGARETNGPASAAGVATA
jgi:hypothetical protein